MLLRLAYLGVTNTFALLRLLPMSNRDKDIEILALRHQIGVLQRQLGDTRVRFSPVDRALLAALLHRLPRQIVHRLRQLVRPDTILRWHRDLLSRHHAKMSRPKRPGRPRTIRSIRVLVLRLVKENPSWGYTSSTARSSASSSASQPPGSTQGRAGHSTVPPIRTNNCLAAATTWAIVSTIPA